MKFYGEKLKQARKRLKLSFEELSEKMDLNRNTLSAWENGVRVPSPVKIKLLAKVMNVSTDEISDLEPDKPLSSNDISEVSPTILSLSTQRNATNERIRALISGINLINKELVDARVIINALLTSESSIIYVKNTGLRYVIANALFLKNLSLDKNESILNKRDFDFFPKAEADANNAEDRVVISTGKRIVKKEGYIPGTRKKKWALISKEPVYDTEGKIEGVVGSFVDITERKCAEEVREIIENNLNAWQTTMFIYDITDKRYVFVNDSFESLTGYPLWKIYDNSLFYYETCIHPDDKKIFAPYLESAPEKKNTIIYRIITSNGNTRAVKTELFTCKKEYIKKYIISISEAITILGG